MYFSLVGHQRRKSPQCGPDADSLDTRRFDVIANPITTMLPTNLEVSVVS